MGALSWASIIGSASVPLASLACCMALRLGCVPTANETVDRSKHMNAMLADHEAVQFGMEQTDTKVEIARSSESERKPQPFRPMSSNKIAQLQEWHAATTSANDPGNNSRCTKKENLTKKRVDIGDEGSTPKQIRLIGTDLSECPATQVEVHEPPLLKLP